MELGDLLETPKIYKTLLIRYLLVDAMSYGRSTYKIYKVNPFTQQSFPFTCLGRT
jgi:hypothetical protein